MKRREALKSLCGFGLLPFVGRSGVVLNGVVLNGEYHESGISGWETGADFLKYAKAGLVENRQFRIKQRVYVPACRIRNCIFVLEPEAAILLGDGCSLEDGIIGSEESVMEPFRNNA